MYSGTYRFFRRLFVLDQSGCIHDIIIIIWQYNPLWGFAFSAKSLQVLLSLAAFFQFLTFSFFRSSITSSCHRCLGFPTGLFPIGFQYSSCLVGLVWSVLWICPSHLTLCVLMCLTIFAPSINPLNPELNPICYLLALLGAHYFLHVSRIMVKLLTFRLLMSYIYGAPILDISRSHTTTQHSRYDSSGRVISSSQRPVPDNTRHSQQINIHATGGIRTHDLSR